MKLVCSWNLLTRWPDDFPLAWLPAQSVTHVELKLPPSDASIDEHPRPVGEWAGRFSSLGLEVGLVDISPGPDDPLLLDPISDRLRCAARHRHARVVRLVVGQASLRGDDASVLRQLGQVAADEGLIIALELAAPGASGRVLLEAIRAIDHPAVRLGFDTGGYLLHNPGAAGDIALERITPWLAALRLRDHTGSPEDRTCPPLGTGGVVDLARVLEIVRALRFDGPVVFDFDPPSRRKESAERFRAGVERCLSQLRIGGWLDPAST